MEHLEFTLGVTPGESGNSPSGDFAHVGVVGSGNLEVMLERQPLAGACRAVVDTSIRGFERTWRQVLTDFVARHRLADVCISINDGGATPAVVTLRLDQAAAEIRRGDA